MKNPGFTSKEEEYFQMQDIYFHKFGHTFPSEENFHSMEEAIVKMDDCIKANRPYTPKYKPNRVY